ncbi:MAG TPA: hypothetical protein VFP28_00625 [Gemmatimonadales bacterium]|nr:hypothetical protein [Gemmatimonadales bacterium]
MRALVLCMLAWMVGRPASAQDTVATRPVLITYLTTTSAYVDAGRDDGLTEGDSVHVVRSGAEVGLLRVAYLSSRQASCDILSDPAALVVGDTLRVARAPAAPAAKAAAVAVRTPEGFHGPGLRGRIGLRYLGVWRRDGVGGRLSQPSLDLRLDGASLGGSPVGLMLDLRTRRTSSTLRDGSSVVDGRTRAYQAALYYGAAGAPFRLTAGRQFSPALASITLLDGALAEFNRSSWGLGVFAGSEPDPVSFGYSNDVADYGGYLQLHNRAASSTTWSTTIGAIGSYQAGFANREFGYLQAMVSSRRLSLFATQEVDYYRPWKQAMGEPALSLSSSFASVRLALSPAFSVNGGVDNRRNVRLYRDAVTPETAFDDTYRQGIWGGWSLDLRGRGRVSFDTRSSSGGSVGRTMSYTLSLAANRVTALGLGVRSRTTRYDGTRQSGWLQSVSLDLTPTPALQLDLNGGFRVEQDPLAAPDRVHVTWFGADADLSVARGWYLMLSVTHERGGFEGNDQLYGGVSYRF